MGFLLNKLCASLPQMIFRDSLRFGDLIEITTKNSTYMLFVVDPNNFLVSGGCASNSRTGR